MSRDKYSTQLCLVLNFPYNSVSCTCKYLLKYVRTYVGQTILKKYYHVLWRAFPEDYMTSLINISKLVTLEQSEIDLITSHSTAVAANKAILDIMILRKGSHKDLLEFCSVMEEVIVDKQKKKIIEQLRNG